MFPMARVLSTVLPVFIVLLLGRLCCIRKLLSREGVNSLKSVAVDIALPAVLLDAFATASYEKNMLLIPLVMFLLCLLLWLAGKGISRLMGEGRSFLPYICTGFEAGMLGYMFFAMLYGQEKSSLFAMVDLGQVLFVFTVYKALVNAEYQGESSLKQLVSAMLRSPVIIAIAVGIALGASGLYARLSETGAGEVLDSCLSFISAPTGVLILLSIGYELSLRDVRWGNVLKAVGARALLMLLVILGGLPIIARFFPAEPMLAKAFLLMCILPPPYVLPVFARDEAQAAYLSSTLSVYTLLSVGCFGVLACM